MQPSQRTSRTSSAPATHGSSLPHYQTRGKLQPPLSNTMSVSHLKARDRLPLNFFASPLQYASLRGLDAPHASYIPSLPCAMRCHLQRGSIPQAAPGLHFWFLVTDNTSDAE